jgi:branched-chain amino acid transport system ATP-binding protein
MDDSALLAVESLRVSYDGSIALNGISLTVRPGEMVCVVGANGAGKTSLIRSIAGMVPSSGGVVRWRGRDITGLPSWEICELGIAQVAEGRQTFSSLTVRDNLLIGGSLKRAERHRAKNLERVYELFPRLHERSRQAAGTLSGGEQQMLAIGRAIMAAPELVMFDEPSVGLSPALTQVMFDVIKLMHGQGVTVLLVEQNVAQCLKLSNRGYVFENGSVVLEGTGESLLNEDSVRRAYLGL